MPRVVNLNRQQLLKDDLKGYIKNEMHHQKIKQSDMAARLGTTQQNFSYLLNKSSFSYEQLIIIFKELGTEEERIVRLMKL